jgi:hypothetical protein
MKRLAFAVLSLLTVGAAAAAGMAGYPWPK